MGWRSDPSYFVLGDVWDEAQGFVLEDGEDPEIFRVEFIVCHSDRTWTTEIHRLPVVFVDCNVPEEDLVEWYCHVVDANRQGERVYIGVLRRGV